MIKYSETSHGAIVTLPLDQPVTTNIFRAETITVIHDQTRQYGYQTVPFGVYIHNLMFSIVVFVYSPLLKLSFIANILISLHEALVNQTGFVLILLALTGCNNVVYHIRMDGAWTLELV